MTEPFRFEMIAFDADDTLWHSELFYETAKEGLAGLLAKYEVSPETVTATLDDVEMSHLPLFGYGIKAFTLSMIETSVRATRGAVRGEDVQAIIDIGKTMVGHEMTLLDHAGQTVARLAESHRLMVITKGDLMDQERKMAGSGLARYFQLVEIVSDKKPGVYAALLERHSVNPERFLMVGNSMRSDILPVLELGGYAVYVPYELSWFHESGEVPDGVDGRFHEIEHLGQLPALVARLESGE